MHTFLCGLPASGKTTYARQLGQERNCLFVDHDQLIIAQYNKSHTPILSCAAIVQRHGDPFFRALESAYLADFITQQQQPSIIALGSGALDDPRNRQLIKNHLLLFLQTPLHICLQRIVQRKPFPTTLDPSAPASSFYRLANKRIPLFLSLADECWTFKLDSYGRPSFTGLMGKETETDGC